MPGRSVAIVVTFHPGPDVPANLEALAREGVSVIVVDNGSGDAELEAVEKTGAGLVRNGANLGIASALNVGILEARARRAEWIFTFDQDSRVKPGFVEAMIDAWRAAERIHGQVGIVAPLYRDQRSGRVLSGVETALADLTLVRKTMTSGNLLRPETFDRVGGYADDYFIDYVDVEFALRCRRAGFAVVQSTKATLLHNLGDTRFREVLGVSFKVAEQSPLRRYYMMRNRLRTYRAFAGFDPRWLADELRMVAFEELKMLLFEKQRAKKLLLQAQAVVDALRGTTGPFRSTEREE